jgi:hypothetical protein
MPQTIPLSGREKSAQQPVRPLPDDPRWQLARRIAASKSFEKSSFLVSFLLYVCEQELCGKGQELNEHQIGVKALGRPATYNPGDDNIVRNYARLLRKRLDEYFQTEGKDEILRVDIPRGHYVPVFYSTEPVQNVPLPSSLLSSASDSALTGKPALRALPAHPSVREATPSSSSGDQSKSSSVVAGYARKGPSDKPAETAARQSSGLVSVVVPELVSGAVAPASLETARSTGHNGRHWLSLVSVLATLNLALFGMLLYGVVWIRSSRIQIPSASVSPSAPVSVFPWSAIFSSPNPTHLIASDPDIDEIQILTSSSISVSDYANHIYIPAQKTLTPEVREICLKLLQGHRAALVDTQVAAEVAALAQSSSRKIQVQGARSLQFSNLKSDDNFIFLGSPRSDPWVSVFDDLLDFRFAIDNAGFESIRNVHPRPHEQIEYVPNGGGGATGQSFAIIAFIRNPDQNGQILLLAGANAEGTQSAGKLVTDLSRLSTELRKCGIPPSGPLVHFELLLHVKMMASSASEYDVVACHILPEAPPR